jgi:hypothetical protein
MRWILGLLFLLFVAGCGRGDKDLPDIGMEMAVSPEPPQLGPAAIAVTLHDAGGNPISGARLTLEGNMNHAGMVPVFADAVEVAPGRYQANIELTMGGDWFILVHADLPDGRSMERKFDLPGVDAICGDTPTP